MTNISTMQTKTNGHPLPEGWQWAKLGDVAEYINGMAFNPADWKTSGLPIIRIQNLTSSEAHFNHYQGEFDKKYLVEHGDLLISWSASLDAYIWQHDKAILNQHIFKVIENSEIITRDYLYYAVREAMDEIRLQVHGATMKHITRPEFLAIQIPLPPLGEQRRIASRLNEQLATVESARKAAEEQLHTAYELPSVYLIDVFESKEAKNWNAAKLGDIASTVQNGIYKTADFYGHGHPFLRMYNLSNRTWNLIFEKMAQVEITEQELSTYKLRKGDLLFSRVNSFELVGKCAWVDETAENFVFENMLIRVRLSDDIDSLFVAQQMQTRYIRKQIEAVAKRAIGQSSINSNDLRELKLVLPPLSTQIEISNQINNQFLACDVLTKSLESQLAEIESLPASLLREAFAGNP